MVRWWNGLGWSDARRSADASIDRVRAAAHDATRGSTITQQVAEIQASRPVLGRTPIAAAGRAVGAAHPFAAAAVAVAVFGLGLGLYGVLPLAGLVLSLIGLARSRRLAREGARSTGLGQ